MKHYTPLMYYIAYGFITLLLCVAKQDPTRHNTIENKRLIVLQCGTFRTTNHIQFRQFIK